jgi:streptogramin lyase
MGAPWFYWLRGQGQLLLFLIALLACTAGPVVAASSEPSDDGNESVYLEETPLVPDGEDIREATEAAERKEEEQRAWLQSPTAIQEREQSRRAYVGIDPEAAKALIRSVFEAELAALDADPARVLSDAQLVGPVNGNTATVRENEKNTLLDAGMPIRDENDNGEMQKVDLSLEPTLEGYEAVNPLVDGLVIPDSAAGEVRLGDEGLSIAAEGVADRVAHRFSDEDIYFNSVLPDTGYLVTPTRGGVELFNVLYSEESPESIHYDLDLPEGAQLQSDGLGGAEVVRDGEQLAHIPFPTAIDAQGTRVPVDLEIDGSSLDLHIAHRAGDYAMPILVDPAIEENYGTAWYFGTNFSSLGLWSYSTNDPTEAWFVKHNYCLTGDLCSPSTRGLFMMSYPKNFPANVWGHWWYWAPGATTYIPSIYPDSSAILNPFWRNNHGCDWNQYPRPYDYDGSFDANGNWQWFETDRAQWSGQAVMYTKAKGIAAGMSTGAGGYVPCYRSTMVGGYVVRLDDEDAPVIQSATVPAGWVGDNANFNLTASASDGSLGVQRIRITPDARPLFEHSLGCSGISTNRCPNSTTTTFGVSADRFAQGERPVYFAALDPTGEPVSNSIQKTIKVDTTAPTITLSGQLAKATSEVGSEEKPAGTGDELNLPVYNLNIKAEDFAVGATGMNKRSGVQNIKVFLDGAEQAVPWTPQSCTTGGCPANMTVNFSAVLTKLQSAGKHKLEVLAIDQVGEQLKRTIEFEYFPATGMKDEYVMQYFPLPDGQGNEAEEEHPRRPELAVNVMNGNLVYRESDIDVESTAGVDLEVDRFYNSMLPDSENTEWGDGWTLGQTPKLKPDQTEGSNPATSGTMLRTSAAFQSSVGLPMASGETEFDSELNALVRKTSTGGYEITDETGEAATSTVFDSTGKVVESRSDGYAKAVYDYEAGKLAGIDVVDPSTFTTEEPPKLLPPKSVAPTFQRAFGTNGSGDGQLQLPADVAIDATGNIWVADRANNRIQKFNSKGEYLAKFGTLGSGNGQLNNPASLALDAAGNIWVADKLNSRIQKFSPSGQYLAQFGSEGTGTGQLKRPEGIAIDAAGNIWVSDTYNYRIQKFNSSGQFLAVVNPTQLGAIEPTGIDAGPGGKIWVADWAHNRVVVLSETGDFVRQFGTAGSGPGQFAQPDAVDVDTQGNVWIGDQNNHRIQRFDQEGKYVGQFGSAGAGQGQFSFGFPFGITTNGKGSLWVADAKNHRIQQFDIPDYRPVYHSAFGVVGSGPRQFNLPADIEMARGSLWIADQGNNRIQELDPGTGEFVSQFGALGSGNGQLKAPASIAVDANGDIWVADKQNHRIEKFNAKGEYLSQFGSSGAGNGQFNGPEGVAIDAAGNIWVSDTYNYRIQKFNAQGQFLGIINPPGLGAIEPTGIDAGPGGKVWVTDWSHNRVVVLTEAGGFVRQFGTGGSGPGQFSHPDAIEVDGQGRVWVGDQSNGRIQQFNQQGEYVTEFGAPGTGTGQFSFSYPFGLTSGSSGRLWIADRNNNRIQRWELPNLTPTEVSVSIEGDDDPSVDVNTEAGLVKTIQGQEAGTHTYGYSGNYLVSHTSPVGQINYEKDLQGRLIKVTLPNGTYGKVEYRSDGRVKKVTVDPAGTAPAKSTSFEYSDAIGTEEARSTKVIPEGAPHITYDIGADGSVLKWWHVQQPPQFIDFEGSLWAEKELKITVGDHLFKVVADSPEGISSIQIIANGNTVVSEQTCQQDEEQFGIECQRIEDEWVVGSYELAPGVLYLEAVVTGRNPEEVESQRFWVDVPYTPPPPDGEPAPPRFKDILKFREEYGLEVVFPVANESELNERIFNLIGAWNNPGTASGQVARASAERWGVPLRPEDVAELEYREQYLRSAGPKISQWGRASRASTYAGFYIDHRAGGVIRVGFTSEQAGSVSALEQQPGVDPDDRIAPFPTQPVYSLQHLEGRSQAFDEAMAGRPDLMQLLTTGALDTRSNTLSIGATATGPVQAFIEEAFGPSSGISVFGDSAKPVLREETFLEEGVRVREMNNRLYAGDWIRTGLFDGGCTLAFGAWEITGTKPNGSPSFANYALTAGHCYPVNAALKRGGYVVKEGKRVEALSNVIGKVQRRSYTINSAGFTTDAEAIRLDGGTELPRWIFWSEGYQSKVNGVIDWTPGMTLCHSGTWGGTHCGPSAPWLIKSYYEGAAGPVWQIRVFDYSIGGDSGSPVFDPVTGSAVGTLSGGPFYNKGPTDITPLRSLEGKPYAQEVLPGTAPGALAAPGMTSPQPLNVVDVN